MIPSIHPSRRGAEEAQQRYVTRVKTSLISLLKSYAQATDSNRIVDGAITDKFRSLRRPLPEFFFLHDRLQQAMRRQDAATATALVNRIVDQSTEFEAGFPSLDINTALKNGDDWEEFARDEARLMTQRDFGRESVFKPLTSEVASKNISHVAAALSLLASTFPEMHDEFFTHVRCIRLFDGAVTMGFTDERMFGAMLLRIPASHIDPVSYYIEHIIHETSHMHLNALMSDGEIVLNDRQERYASPIRPDPRPMLGVFHATFVTSRIVQGLLKLIRATGERDFLAALAQASDELIRGYREISSLGSISEYGKPIIRELVEQIGQLAQLQEWKDFDFHLPRGHRYGAGNSHVETLHRCVKHAESAEI